MDVKPGYKQTELGVIPKEWGEDSIANLASITTGAKNTQDRVEDGTYPFFVRSQTVERINSYSFDGEAVLTAGDGVGTGKVFHYIKGRFDYHQRVYKISDFREKLDGYYFYLYFSTHFYDRIMSMTAKSSVDSVRMEMIADMKIPLPPIPEQKAIATALRDSDSLIASLDQIIAKKRDIKLATIQQLLTGKRRLPGHSSEWEVKPLGDIAQIISGGTPSTAIDEYWDGDILWCTPSDITQQKGKYLLTTSRKITRQGLSNSSANLLPAGALLLCSRATIGEVKIATASVCTNQGFKSLICNAGIDNEFLYYCLLTLKPKLLEKASGSTFLEISKKDTALIEVNLPELSEQQAIATVLSDMDAELELLEEQRDKTIALKNGLMQELLTGKTRLV